MFAGGPNEQVSILSMGNNEIVFARDIYERASERVVCVLINNSERLLTLTMRWRHRQSGH